MIACPRLDLVSLGPDVLAAIDAGHVDAAQQLLPFAITEEWVAGVPARRRLDQIAADPEIQPWLVRAMVLRDEQRAVGNIGCHGRPDDQGRIELGYKVLVLDRRRGFAREAVAGILGWAGAHGAGGVILSISPDNAASLSLARDLGLIQTGEQIDKEDGLELVFERTLPPSGSTGVGRLTE